MFTREQLLSRVWGYEYYGGARTVDVHVRRLRAKLGEEHANLIQTVRSVGYRFGQIALAAALSPTRESLTTADAVGAAASASSDEQPADERRPDRADERTGRSAR